MTRDECRKVAKGLNVKGWHKMRKAELEAAIGSHESTEYRANLEQAVQKRVDAKLRRASKFEKGAAKQEIGSKLHRHYTRQARKARANADRLAIKWGLDRREAA